MAAEGFHHRGRVVWSIVYTLDAPPPAVAALVVPLDSHGNALNGLATADPPDRPVVTVKPGEWIRFRGRPHLVLGVDVYSATGGDEGFRSFGHLLAPSGATGA